ncbi:class I SAM-dependent methyltransferase [Staphylococcus sp. Marseille-Q5304]|uniref:class I SAM-dependent methyltransferase n=1 Tax=Staphylococcus sp. Marseille-Q5304 TaxID=2942200 RepID=UPI002072B2B9|nr:class I SAM-dependent methyltransferase [Staphylococcus sp. Marseille-Q5304]
MNEALFNQLAQTYDNPTRIEQSQIIADEVNKILDTKQYETLLDYGGGTGIVTLSIAHHFKSVTLMDSSEQMVNVFKEKYKALDKINMHGFVGDILTDSGIVTEKEQYDVIFLSLVLLHSGDYQQLLKQLEPQLKQNGMFIIVDFDKNDKVSHPAVYNGFHQSEIKQTLETIGLKDIHTHTFYHGKQIFMNQEASMFIASGLKR